MGLKLAETQARVIVTLQRLGGKVYIKKLAEEASLKEIVVLRACKELSALGLVELREVRAFYVKLTEEGKLYAESGLPERRLLDIVINHGGVVGAEDAAIMSGLSKDVVPIAIGWLIKKKWAEVERHGKELTLKAKVRQELGPDEVLLRLLAGYDEAPLDSVDASLRGAVKVLVRRGLAKQYERTLTEVSLTQLGSQRLEEGLEVVQELSLIPPELIATGKWREYALKKYDITAPEPLQWPGKRQPYLKFLDEVKEKLVALGFKQMEGPVVELMFFNCDALYMPQDHPAREIHDLYFIKAPEYGDLTQYRKLVYRVAKAHESGWKTGSKGWRYKYSSKEASRLILRSHGTAISARTLISQELEIPGKYFSVVRVFRPDVIDKTHLPEFNQVEGIIIGEGLCLRDLLGVLAKFAKDFAGADAVKFRPDYFPFTEPSVELLAYKEGYGWMEFGGSGIFRPELTLPLGVKEPVIAWGIGIDRLFMMRSGINDIRMLFTHDLDWIRRAKVI